MSPQGAVQLVQVLVRSLFSISPYRYIHLIRMQATEISTSFIEQFYSSILAHLLLIFRVAYTQGSSLFTLSGLI